LTTLTVSRPPSNLTQKVVDFYAPHSRWSPTEVTVSK